MEALFGLLGALLGSLISWLTSDRQAKMKTTLDLHREFNSGEVLQSRRPADRVFAKYLDQTYDQFSATLEPDEYSPLWHVINFYQRLWIAIKHQQLITSMVPDLFGEVFMRWYIPYFEKMIVPLGWSSSKNIQELRNWFEKHADQQDFKEWLKLGRQDRENILKRNGFLPGQPEQPLLEEQTPSDRVPERRTDQP
jgi:hypothetical protein